MPRSPRPHIELEGPIFDPDVIHAFKHAVGEEIDKVGREGVPILSGFITGGGFMASGAFAASVKVEIRRTGDSVGYAKVAPAAVWPKPGRPTRTWMERGYRRGVRLTKGTWAFRKTTSQMNAADYTQRFAARIAEVLG